MVLYTVFTTFWPLGFVAFGGPQAHVAILRDHLVLRRDWITEEQFLELYAIGQVRIATNGSSCSPRNPASCF
jgi:chromate transporter